MKSGEEPRIAAEGQPRVAVPGEADTATKEPGRGPRQEVDTEGKVKAEDHHRQCRGWDLEEATQERREAEVAAGWPEESKAGTPVEDTGLGMGRHPEGSRP